MKKWKKILLTVLSGISSVGFAYLFSIGGMHFITEPIYIWTNEYGSRITEFNWYGFLWFMLSVLPLTTAILTIVFLWAKRRTKEDEIARLEAKLNKLKGE